MSLDIDASQWSKAVDDGEDLEVHEYGVQFPDGTTVWDDIGWNFADAQDRARFSLGWAQRARDLHSGVTAVPKFVVREISVSFGAVRATGHE